jgi:hypothetical protein
MDDARKEGEGDPRTDGGIGIPRNTAKRSLRGSRRHHLKGMQED